MKIPIKMLKQRMKPIRIKIMLIVNMMKTMMRMNKNLALTPLRCKGSNNFYLKILELLPAAPVAT